MDSVILGQEYIETLIRQGMSNEPFVLMASVKRVPALFYKAGNSLSCCFFDRHPPLILGKTLTFQHFQAKGVRSLEGALPRVMR
jgi:hypothetical protein